MGEALVQSWDAVHCRAPDCAKQKPPLWFLVTGKERRLRCGLFLVTERVLYPISGPGGNDFCGPWMHSSPRGGEVSPLGTVSANVARKSVQRRAKCAEMPGTAWFRKRGTIPTLLRESPATMQRCNTWCGLLLRCPPASLLDSGRGGGGGACFGPDFLPLAMFFGGESFAVEGLGHGWILRRVRAG